MLVLFSKRVFHVLKVHYTSGLFWNIRGAIFTGKLLTLRVTHRVVIYKKRWCGHLFLAQGLKQFVLARSGGGFLRFQLFLKLFLLGNILGFVAQVFVELLLFDRRNSSLLQVLIHVNVRWILSLVIFQLFLVTTGLTPAVIFGTWNIPLLVVNELIHCFIFLFLVFIKNNYTKTFLKKFI